MTTNLTGTTLQHDQQEAESMFASILGLADVDTVVESAGSRDFLKFQVGSPAPIYYHAIEKTGQQLGKRNMFRGMMGIKEKAARAFPGSMESKVLAAVLTRSTRTISQDGNAPEWGLEHVPFRNSEDSKLMQPATHIVVGRRGVGKSTLIVKVVQSLRRAGRPCVVIDMQRFAHRNDKSLDADVLSDLAQAILAAVEGNLSDLSRPMASLRALRARLAEGTISAQRAVMPLSEHIRTITTALDKDLFVFLDDFHLIDSSRQAALLDLVHGCLKGARGWLKVAAIESLLRHYDAKSRKGLQIPGDAQRISLDLSLVNPEAAEDQLKAILQRFLKLVGVTEVGHVIEGRAFERLVWANAGVARDFLQMFGRALEHASEKGRRKITLTDANLAIGEFGDQKMRELEQDAQNDKSQLEQCLAYIEKYCLEGTRGTGGSKANGFLIRNDSSPEYRAVQALKDLRLVHLLHQTITPSKAGERYEAYIIDYSLFTGFRRRQNIQEIRPGQGKQFQAKELRKLPPLPPQFLQRLGQTA